MPEIPFPPPLPETSYGADWHTASLNFNKGVYSNGDTVENKGTYSEKSQLVKEFELLELYKESPMSPVLSNALDELKRFSGIGVPKFRMVEDINDDQTTSSDPDMTEKIEGGFSKFGMTNSELNSSLLLISPVKPEITQAEYDQLDEIGKYNMSKGKYGEYIATRIGEGIPTETKELLINLYNLTDSELVRDDGDGNRVLRGKYQDTEVFFVERATSYISYPNGSAYTVHSVEIKGKEAGEQALEMFSSADLEQLRVRGLFALDLLTIGISHSNLGDHLASIDQINRIMEEADEMEPIDRTIAGMMAVRDYFVEQRAEVTDNDGKVHNSDEVAGVVTLAIFDAFNRITERRARYNRASRLGKLFLKITGRA